MHRILIAILIIVVGCQSTDQPEEVQILKENQMVEIIKDIQLLEAAHKDIGIFGPEKKALTDTSYAIVFKKHEVRASDFDSTYNFYLRNPIRFEALMTKVERSINLNP